MQRDAESIFLCVFGAGEEALPEYFWFHPHTLEFNGFRFMGGKYQPLEPTAEGWLWSEELELFLGVYESKLRFFSSDKQLVASPEKRAQVAETKLEELKARLKTLGVEPDELGY